MQKTLPKGWKWVRLGDEKASQIIMGQSPPSSAYNSEGIGLPFYQGKAEFGEHHPETVKWCSQPIKIAEADDILISVRAPVGNVNICEEKSCIGRGLAAIRINKTSVNNKFLYYFFKRDTSIWSKLSTGSIFDSITVKTLQSFFIPLPPLPTQHKIVEILEEADNLRKLRKLADVKMKDLIPSLFVQMFGDPTTNPKGWEVKKLGGICEFVYGDSLPEKKRNSGNITVYGSNGIVGTHDIAITESETIIIGRKGSVGEVNFSSMPCFPIDTTYFIDKRYTKQNLVWLFWLLKFLKLEKLSLMVGVPGLNRNHAYDLKAIVPPLPLQQEFAKLVEDIEAEKARQAESGKKLDELFNSLMQRAFTGELVG